VRPPGRAQHEVKGNPEAQTLVAKLGRTQSMARALQLAKTYIDWPVMLRGRVGPIPPFRTYVVERRRNAKNVTRLREASVAFHSHDLDGKEGLKFDLISVLLAQNPPHSGEWIVVADDDVRITRGTLGAFVAIADRCGFDVAQPGHDRRGFINFGITVSKPFVRARHTSFVEIGPIFAVGPKSQSSVLRTFGGAGMGWGLETIWHDMELRLGIVDEIRMRHLAPAGNEYDVGKAVRDREELMRSHNLNREQAHETLSTIHAWRPIDVIA
jgi:hypothetical protein